MAVVLPAPPSLATKIYQNNVARDFAKVHNGDVLGNVIHNEKHYKAYVLQARRSVLIEPSERIGAIACVAGLKDLVSKIQAKLASSESSESLPSGLEVEVQSSNAALNELHEQFQATNRPDDFSTLITCRQALTSSTNAVKLFDELYSAVLRIDTEDAPTLSSLALFIERLQWQTTIWQLQINILQSTSAVEASRNSRELHKSIEHRLSLDLELERRVESVDTDMVQIMSEIDEAMLDFQRRSISEHENIVDPSTNRMSLNFEELSTALDVSQTHATKGLLSSLSYCCNLAAQTLPLARNQLVLCRTRVNQNQDHGSYHVYQIAIDHCDITIATYGKCATRLQRLAFEDDARQQDQLMAMAQELVSAWAHFATVIKAVAGKQLDIGNLKRQLRPLHNAFKGLGRGQLHQTLGPAHRGDRTPVNESSETLRWSGLSELTLADTAVMSIMTLPVFVSELKHGSFYEMESKTALEGDQTKKQMDRSLITASSQQVQLQRSDQQSSVHKPSWNPAQKKVSRYACSHCPCTFARKADRKKHLQDVCKMLEEGMICPSCTHIGRNLHQVKRHQSTTFHPEPEEVVRLSQRRAFTCSNDGIIYYSVEAFFRHFGTPECALNDYKGSHFHQERVITLLQESRVPLNHENAIDLHKILHQFCQARDLTEGRWKTLVRSLPDDTALAFASRLEWGCHAEGTALSRLGYSSKNDMVATILTAAAENYRIRRPVDSLDSQTNEESLSEKPLPSNPLHALDTADLPKLWSLRLEDVEAASSFSRPELGEEYPWHFVRHESAEAGAGSQFF